LAEIRTLRQLSPWALRGPCREARGIAVQSAESEYVAQNLTTLDEDKAKEVLELVDALEQDEDVQRVFHNLG